MPIGADTSAEAARIQQDILRRMDGPARLIVATRMSDEARAVTLAGIRHRHAQWTEPAVQSELLRLMLGEALAHAALESRRARR